MRDPVQQETNFLATPRPVLSHDIALIGSMMVLAACGLIYEYLLAHYAGRIIGAVETSIYGMIGIMIVAMGIGAFLAKWVKDPFRGFAWLEVSIAFVGGCSVLIMATMVALTYTLPAWLQDIYELHPSMTTDGGVVDILQHASFLLPFLFGFILGAMIGMEIPLIARIRETIHGKHLLHNTGTIYGADYIGAGVGAAIWIYVCLKIPILLAAIGTASVNALVGIFFLFRYRSQIRAPMGLWVAHGLLIVTLVLLAIGGARWINSMNSTLFKDKVEYTKVTPYQHITLTKRIKGKGLPEVISLYLNGRLQFSSNDEVIYHSFLTYPAMLTSARHEKILVIGGGDGLAVRDILQWKPDLVTLIDLDKAMIDLFSGKDEAVPEGINRKILALNEKALLDKRVQIIIGDAFLEIEKLISNEQYYDTIIIDLPDPSHPDLNKLYSSYFYKRLRELLSGDGTIAIQSTSPYHAKKAFISIGKTLESAGFVVNQYHANVPTFGEWGWSIGSKYGESPLQRIHDFSTLPVAAQWMSLAQIQAAFVFAPDFYQNTDGIEINTLGSNMVYQYHHDAWSKEDGIFFINR
ncbi:MAG: polyamine aminopropyltransferase [Gammaproteobacteria bacterium]|nr:polyamine aminopropyltransferase [Gammaproteobacteria bacterium]